MVEDDSDDDMPPLETNFIPFLFQDILRQNQHRVQQERRQVPRCSICLRNGVYGRQCADGCRVRKHSHKTCRQCLSYHFANFSNHPVSVNTPFMCCPAEGCMAPYSDEAQASIKGSMPPATVQRLEAHIEECVQRANPKVPCPKCHASIQVAAAGLKDRAPGTMGVVCTECNHAFCFPCLEPVPRRAARMARQPHLVLPLCGKCVDRPLYPTPGKFNRYFRRSRPAKEGEFVLLRNSELTVEEVVDQVEDMCTGETMHVPCMKCGCELHRSSACNELCHCGMVRCDVCGMSGLDYDSHLIDHWGSGLGRTCPRWGAGSPEEFWQHTVFAPSHKRCKEGVCRNDDHIRQRARRFSARSDRRASAAPPECVHAQPDKPHAARGGQPHRGKKGRGGQVAQPAVLGVSPRATGVMEDQEYSHTSLSGSWVAGTMQHCARPRFVCRSPPPHFFSFRYKKAQTVVRYACQKFRQ